MGTLYRLKTLIEEHIEKHHLDAFRTKGALILKTGIPLAMINPNTPDNLEEIRRVRNAIKEVLGIDPPMV